MTEIWKDIVGYEGLYQVSNLGNVKRLKGYKGRGKGYIVEEHLIQPSINSRGYQNVVLCKNGKTKTFSMHRLVAIAFLDNSNNLQQVNHKDEDKTNNCVYNLEWCDATYNNNYGTRNKKCSDKWKLKRLQKELVIC